MLDQFGPIWGDIENLFIALGAEITEGSGSRIRVIFNEAEHVFHRPHPARDADKSTIVETRKFLITAGVVYEL